MPAFWLIVEATEVGVYVTVSDLIQSHELHNVRVKKGVKSLLCMGSCLSIKICSTKESDIPFFPSWTQAGVSLDQDHGAAYRVVLTKAVYFESQ